MRLIPLSHRLSRATVRATVTGWRPVPWLRRSLLLAGLALLAPLFAASAAHAEAVQALALAGSVNDVLNNVRNWIMGILAGLATVFLSIGGVRYVMAGGDPSEVEKAKTAFKSAGLGYALAALAPLVVQILKGIVGA
ncbi:pilin [Streptantibioticus ferralitis]|uniref:Pilin n=1 Tax=Streptantibioticus ferralitis TaxID=236510 RepID=A0ABT5Z3D3_9ACTN|nr:pilin [Streptantibioticus ferralitis]MDF2258341.1 pilin [Streptantibioticus ferralitis]